MNASRDMFLNTADRIGARLCRDALWADERCNWLGAMADVSGRFMMPVCQSFGPDLYLGTGGIALFLAHLYRTAPTLQYRTTALGAIRQALSRLDYFDETKFGIYTGMSSLAYVLMQIEEIFEEEAAGRQGITLLEDLSQTPPVSPALDIMGGIAGYIAALLYAHKKYRNDWFLEQALAQGNILVDRAKKDESGWSWPTMPSQMMQGNLTGFSHGTAGIAWTLLELYYVTRERQFLEGAEEGFRYERQWYSDEEENWADLRVLNSADQVDPIYMNAWCHGAPGIALSRIRAYSLTGNSLYKEEAEHALNTTRKSFEEDEPVINYSMCHGVAGNADVLLYAADILQDGSYRLEAEQVGQRGIDMYEENRRSWPSGTAAREYTPGLMLGEAGTGYFFLRLYDSKQVPSILIPIPE